MKVLGCALDRYLGDQLPAAYMYIGGYSPCEQALAIT